MPRSTEKSNSKILPSALVVVALCLSVQAVPAQERCAEAPVDVTAPSKGEQLLVCSAAEAALRMLDHCGISARRRLQVHVLPEVRHPLSGPIFGLFDIRYERVLITRYANVAALVADTPYRTLPPLEFYGSLVVHEVVHGVLHQNYGRQPRTRAAYEYPAYALQIEYLSAGAREKFVQTSARDADSKNRYLFSDAILMFDPFFFAARAHAHFKSFAHGCADVRALLDGDVDFIAPP